MRSDEVKTGYQRAPNRSLLRSLGITEQDMGLPFIGIANAYNTIVPGHTHLRQLTEKVREPDQAWYATPGFLGAVLLGFCLFLNIYFW